MGDMLVACTVTHHCCFPIKVNCWFDGVFLPASYGSYSPSLRLKQPA